jgi:hypothetical protein
MTDDACGVDGFGFDPYLGDLNDRLGEYVEVLQDAPSEP